MPTHTHLLPAKSTTDSKGRNTQTTEPGAEKPSGASDERPVASQSEPHVWSKLLAVLSAAVEKPWMVVMPGVALLLLLALAVKIQSVISPQYTVTVQQFEITPEVSQRLGVTGKGAADLVIDTLNGTATDASRFHGAEYYAYDHNGIQPIALDEGIRVPVQSSYDIEVHGISVDTMVRAYRHIRYKQWLISGDVLAKGDGYAVTLRLNQDDEPRSWDVGPVPAAEVARQIHRVTEDMLKEKSPEVFGSALLKQANQNEKTAARKYAETEGVFREWAMREPTNWKPYYYLSLAYDAGGKEQEATSLARWSTTIAAHEKQVRFRRSVTSTVADKAKPAALAQATEAAWDAMGEAGTRERSTESVKTELDRLQNAERKLEALCADKRGNLTYQIELAKVLAREAEVESKLSPEGPKQASATQARAVGLLATAVDKMPRNGGLHEQHAVLLQGLVRMGRATGDDPQWLAEQEAGEVNEFTRALELRPTQVSPLWGAVFALIHLGRQTEAVQLARTITLLQPESTAARTAYVVALAHATSLPGRQATVATLLDPLLETAREDEMQTLWSTFKDQGDGVSLERTMSAGRRRFPQNTSFGKADGPATPAEGNGD